MENKELNGLTEEEVRELSERVFLDSRRYDSSGGDGI